jgi:hypothetical protein
MQRYIAIYKRSPLVMLVLVLLLTISIICPSFACTIFVLTDGHRVLFCNNEDWTNPNTRIWFVPGGNDYYGCVYVGYDDGWARGGMNTVGLACDWVGGFMENWQADVSTCVRGNPTQRLLESCATIEEAIAFFKKHKEPDFIRAKIFIADKNGKSAIIGSRDGKLQIEKSNQSNSFGYAFQISRECLARDSEPTMTNGSSILRACLQEGKYATKYSNVFDLKSGDIYLYQFHQNVESMHLNLRTEFDKGGHYYDMQQIHKQFPQAVMPLLINMKRFFLDDFPPISNPNTEIIKHFRAVMEDAMNGSMCEEDYAPALWSSISSIQKDIRNDFRRYGGFKSITAVECKQNLNRNISWFRVEFGKIILLMRFELDDQNKITFFKSEGVERLPGADLEE